jgi:type I restriction enzyme M protein
MPKRHRLEPGNWESVFGRLEELVLANSGEDEFQEIFKLLVAKLFAESEQGTGQFMPEESARATAEGVDRLLASASARWPGIVNEPRSRLNPEHLHVCVEAIAPYSLKDSRLGVLDALFEHLISRSAKGTKGQYFTPRHVVEACIRMLNPSPSDLVLDPACGSGGFLLHAFAHVQQHHPQIDPAKYARSQLWGADFDQRAIQVAKALMLVAGDGHSNLYRLNSLLTPETPRELFAAAGGGEEGEEGLTLEDVTRARLRSFRGFDVIATNPPFAGEVREAGLLSAYELARPTARNERDVLFLERCIKLLRSGGRLAIVLPHNKFATNVWAYVREWAMRRMRVVAVLGLGRNTFLPHTHQKADVLFGIKRERLARSLGDERILFLVSERAGKDSKGQIQSFGEAPLDAAMWDRADHDLEEAVLRFAKFVEEESLPWGG